MTSPGTSDKIDMTMMYAIHRALRRDLERIARAAARTGDDPTKLHATHVGWELFKQFLTLHHTTEDIMLWPRMRELLAGQPDQLALMDAMEREHGRIDPLIEGVDTALADRDHGPERLGDLTDALVTELSEHLRHEEQDAIPVIERTLPVADWLRFGEEQRSRVGMDAASKYLPWLLDEASGDQIEQVLGSIPPHLHDVYRDNWLPRYREQDPWQLARESA